MVIRKQHPHKKPRLLILETDLIYREMFSAALAGTGVEYDFGANGLDGLNLIKEHGHYRVIICNLFMPIMDGLNFIKALQENDYLPDRLLLLHEASPMELSPILKRINKILPKQKDSQIKALNKAHYSITDILSNVL